MIDENKRAQDFAAKEKERRRMRVTVDPANYEYKAEQAPIDFYDKSVPHSVGIYVRVSTTDIRQTTSFELQQKYYLDYVKEWPNWTLYSLYADAADIIGLNQNPFTEGNDLVLFFLGHL